MPEFKAATSVPVTVILDKTMLPTDSMFTIPIGFAEIQIPQPLPPNQSAEQTDTWWQEGNGRSITLGPSDQCSTICGPATATILYGNAKPVFYVSTMVGKSEYVAGDNAAGDVGGFIGQLYMCDVGNDTAAQKSSGIGPCKNWDGYNGTWMGIDEKCNEFNNQSIGGPPPPADVAKGLPSWLAWNFMHSGDTGKITFNVSACFDEQNLARTFEYKITALAAQVGSNPPKQLPFGGRSTVQASESFNVVVAPAAVLQTHAIPYTILYQPPGDESTVSFSAADTYGTQFSINNSKSVDDKSSTSQSSSVNFAEDMAFVFGFTAGSKSTDTTKTVKDFGTVQGGGPQGMSSAAFSFQYGLPADASLVPGAGVVCTQSGGNLCTSTTQTPNLYASEPFWDDLFELLVQPQFAIWVVGSDVDRYQMYGAVPALADVSVTVLDACANGQTTNYGVLDPCTLSYSGSDLTASKNGGVGSNGVSGTAKLSAAEAKALLALDPFYTGGQAAVIDASRANLIKSQTYGASATEPDESIGATFTNTDQLQMNQNAQSSYSTDVTNTEGTTSSVGVTVKMSTGGGGGGGTSAGGDESLTVGSDDQTSTETDIQFTYQNSTAVSKQKVTSATVTLNDVANCSATVTTDCHGPLATQPSANIYLDRVFGSFMFQDPNAPKEYSRDKVPLCCILLTHSLFLQESRNPRFSDVPRNDPNVGAIGVLALTQVLPGNSDGTFKPNDPMTREQLAVAMAQAAHLPQAASNTKFTDVASDDPNLRMISSAIAAKAVVPRSAQEFGANDPITQADLTSALSSAGLTKTTGATSSQPAGQLTRAQAAKAIFEVLKNR